MSPAETFTPIFEPCAHCHQIGKGAKNSTGPVLNGLIDRPAASTPHPYSEVMRASGLIWDEATLRAFTKDPRQLVPGTMMIFKGLPDEKINPLIDFIRSISANN
jgi:cytochrome c